MSVNVKVSLLLRKFTNGQEVVEVPSGSPIECLRSLEEQSPGIGSWIWDKKGGLRSQVWLFANSNRILGDELNKPLNDGDELSVMLALAGG